MFCLVIHRCLSHIASHCIQLRLRKELHIRLVVFKQPSKHLGGSNCRLQSPLKSLPIWLLKRKMIHLVPLSG